MGMPQLSGKNFLSPLTANLFACNVKPEALALLDGNSKENQECFSCVINNKAKVFHLLRRSGFKRKLPLELFQSLLLNQDHYSTHLFLQWYWYLKPLLRTDSNWDSVIKSLLLSRYYLIASHWPRDVEKEKKSFLRHFIHENIQMDAAAKRATLQGEH